MADTFNVEIREDFGSRAAQRLRQAGIIPAILYGHGQETVHLKVPSDQVSAAIRHGGKLIELTGAVSASAVLKEVQWDAFGMDVLHMDLTRVTAGEKVEMSVPIELRGESPGVKEGGIVEHVLHDVEILCPAGSLPDKLQVGINDLHLESAVYASDLQLPDGASLITPPETLIVHCVPAAPVEEELGLGEEAEPEIIGRKAEEEQEEKES